MTAPPIPPAPDVAAKLAEALRAIGGSDSSWDFGRDSHFEDCPVAQGCPDHVDEEIADDIDIIDHEDETDCDLCLERCDCTLKPIFKNAALARKLVALYDASLRRDGEEK